MRLVIQLGVLAAIVIGVQLWQTRSALRGPAPELAGATTEGQITSLADYRGAPLALHFWGSWCGVCRAEQPTIVALAEKHPVLTVASFSGAPEEVAGYLAEHPIGAPTLVDPTGVLARRFRVTAYPTTFVLDGTGNIDYVAAGYTSELGLRIRLWLATLAL